jgi:hypothetical protein
MILKVVLAQPIFDNYKHAPQKSKEGLKKEKVTSFASILENTIQSKATGN